MESRAAQRVNWSASIDDPVPNASCTLRLVTTETTHTHRVLALHVTLAVMQQALHKKALL